jgi:hypothetical protein
VKATFLLADAVQAADGKLSVLGGGWNFTGPQVGPSALGAIIEVPWNETNTPHQIVFELQDTDGQPARIGPEAQPIRIETRVEVGRPPGHPPGTSINVPLAMNIGPLPLVPGQRYVWVLSIDGDSHEQWQVAFNVRSGGPAGAAGPRSPG